MFSKDNFKRLAEQAQKAGTRLATNAGGTTNQWFAGQTSPERGTGVAGVTPGLLVLFVHLMKSAVMQGTCLRVFLSCHQSRLLSNCSG